MEQLGEDWTSALDCLTSNKKLDYLDYLIKKHSPPPQPEREEVTTEEGKTETKPHKFELQVYVKPHQQPDPKDIDESTLIQTSRKMVYTISEETFNKLTVDPYKCMGFKELTSKDEKTKIKQVTIQLQKGQELTSSNFEEYILQVLEYLEGKRQKFEFNKRNQFDFIYLCDVFQLQAVKQTLMSYLSQNFDIQNVFEFLRLAAQDPYNKDTLRESYWIIVFIYLRKIGWDISESFQNDKTKNMLTNVNPYEYQFQKGFLVHEPTQKKIELSVFVPIALEERDAKNKYLLTNNAHNLTKVERIKSEQGLFSDYPHHYQLKFEGKNNIELYAERQTENGEFNISTQQGVYGQYGRSYIGMIYPNFLGTKFEVYDYGVEQGYILKDLPKDFLPTRRRIATIEYDTNFFAEKPRSFRITIYNFEKYKDNEIFARFENLPPKFNVERNCYTLNFYGRVSKASARNFQLIQSEGDEDEVILSHGKCMKNEFNLDFRAPFNQLIAFGVSLSAIGKKRVVG